MKQADLGCILDIVQPDHPFYAAMVSEPRDAVAAWDRTFRDAAKGRRKAAHERSADHELRTRRTAMRTTAEREGKADMRAGVIARHFKRGDITKAQATAAATLRRDYLVGDGDGRVLGRQISRYGEQGGGGGAGFHPPYTGAESRESYDRAMAAVGPDLGPILHHVVIEDRPAADWVARDRPLARSTCTALGMERLRLALNALVRHYGLIRTR